MPAMTTDRRYPLVEQSDGSWLQTAPERCPNGHVLAHNCRATWLGCICPGASHNVWTCNTCSSAIYDPPHDGTMPPAVHLPR